MLGKGRRISFSLGPNWTSLRKTSEGIPQCDKEAVDFVDTAAGGATKPISVPFILFLTASGIWPIKEAFLFSGNILLLTKWLHTPVLQIQSSTGRVCTCSFQHVLAKGYLRWNSLFCWSAEEKAKISYIIQIIENCWMDGGWNILVIDMLNFLSFTCLMLMSFIFYSPGIW